MTTQYQDISSNASMNADAYQAIDSGIDENVLIYPQGQPIIGCIPAFEVVDLLIVFFLLFRGATVRELQSVFTSMDQGVINREEAVALPLDGQHSS